MRTKIFLKPMFKFKINLKKIQFFPQQNETFKINNFLDYEEEFINKGLISNA